MRVRPARAIVLLGPPGAGKTTAGRLAAAALGLSFADLDEEIARSRGQSVEEVFREGEPLFRALELFMLPPLLRSVRVLAVGGGGVEGGRARALLAAHPCILLQVEPARAVARLIAGAEDGGRGRPWLDGTVDPLAHYRKREAPRLAHRERLAWATVSGDPALADVVPALTAALRSLR